MSGETRSAEQAVSRLPGWLVLGGAAAWRIAAMALVGWLVLQLLARVRLLAVSFLIAIVVTALLAPLARLLRRHRAPRGLSALLPLVLGIGVVAAVVTLFARGLAQQWDGLVASARRGFAQLLEWIERSPIALPDLSGIASGGVATDRVAEGAIQTVTTTLKIGSGILLVLVIAFFLLRDGERIASVLLRGFTTGARRERARRAAERAWETLERYIVGIALVSAINTALTGVALLVLDIPMVVPLVLFTFVACFIPFVGTIVANVAGALVALAERGPEIALIFLGVGIAIEALESNVTQPLVQGRALHVHPLLVVAVVTAGTVAFGLPGAFLAVPVLAVAYGVVKSLREDGRPDEPSKALPQAEEVGGASPAPAS